MFRYRIRKGSQVPPNGFIKIPESLIGEIVAEVLKKGYGIEIQPYSKAGVR